MLLAPQSEANLPCSWLDKFYAPAKGPGHILPHEVDIKAFLYEDCTPQPPCSCTAVNFDGNDPGTRPGCLLHCMVAACSSTIAMRQ